MRSCTSLPAAIPTLPDHKTELPFGHDTVIQLPNSLHSFLWPSVCLFAAASISGLDPRHLLPPWAGVNRPPLVALQPWKSN